MAYSKKLTDVLSYYAKFIFDADFVISSDQKKVVDFCRNLEESGFMFEGKPFKVADYLLNVPIFNSSHEPSGVYEDWLHPFLPFGVVTENYAAPYKEIKLPTKGKLASLAMRYLSNIAKVEIGDSLLVSDKSLLVHNQALNKVLAEYVANLGKPSFLLINVIEDGIHARTVSSVNIDPIKYFNFGDLTFGNERLLSEEEIVKYNIIGFFAGSERGMSILQPGPMPPKRDPYGSN